MATPVDYVDDDLLDEILDGLLGLAPATPDSNPCAICGGAAGALSLCDPCALSTVVAAPAS